jgi:Flp pilus assembly pilin Flp
MRRLRSLVVGFIRREEGATMVEYALMLVFVLAVCFSIAQALGITVNGAFSNPGLSAAL